MRMAVGHRVVIADHHEQHRQREIGVVDRALLADHTRPRVRLAAGADVRDHSLLSGNDVEEHVRDHDGAEDRANMYVRRARAEHVEQRPRAQHHESEDERCKDVLVALERTTQSVVDEPAAGERGDADRDRGCGRQRHHVAVDQVGRGAEPIDECEQGDAGQPRRVRLPFRPVEVCGERLALRTRQELLADVETAAVHGPQLPEDTALRVRGPGGRERVVQHHEIERGADPCDAGDQVQPAHQQTQPVENVGFHRNKPEMLRISLTRSILRTLLPLPARGEWVGVRDAGRGLA